mgnify:CR=1 FL=1
MGDDHAVPVPRGVRAPEPEPLLHEGRDLPPDDPFDGERASAFSGFCGLAAERWPFTPDAIAVSLISKAIRLIGQPADDLIALRDQAASLYKERRARGLTRPSVRQPVLKLIAAFKFTCLDGDDAPWHPPIIGTKIFYFKSRFFKRRSFPAPIVPPVEKQILAKLAPAPFRDMTLEELEGNPAHPISPEDIRTEDYPSFNPDLVTLDRNGNASLIIEEGDENG